MACSICTSSLKEEPDDLLGGVFSGSGDQGPSPSKKRKSSGKATSGGPSTSRAGSDEETSQCVTTPCGHVYHRVCIMQWMEVKTRNRTKNCPICQKPITKKGLKPVYLDWGPGEGIERKLKEEVEDKSRRLVECKQGQREMSRRIDELFEENEKLKKKNRDLEGVTRTSDIFWKSMEEKNRKLEGKNRELEEKYKESVKNREFKRRNGELKVTNRELNDRNQKLINKLEAAKRKCVEAEEKYGNLRGTVARMMEISSTFSKEISTELKIYSVLGREIDGGGEGREEVD